MKEFHEKPIAFIQTKKGKFQAKIGVCHLSDGDDDCVVVCHYTKPSTETLEESQEHIRAAQREFPDMAGFFLNPTPYDSDGITWLSVILNANKEA